MKTTTYWQQGDVLLAKVDSIPKDLELEMSARFKGEKNQDLAYGEAHDHCHFLDGDVQILKSKTGERYINVISDARLKHIKMSTGEKAEHDTQVVEKGLYKFGQIQEFDPFEQLKRNVID